ncbi:MAG: hypothetical protein JWN15_1817, partial [Firmicutes bacterium]|nr:hypothetical protein [Bacillota bacterium]
MDADELELILRAVGGDADSFGVLADRYTPTLLGLIYTFVGSTETARDLTQEALLKAYTALGTLHRPERFGSWLRQIAANLAKSHLRQQSHRQTIPLEEHLQQDESAPVDQALLRDELLSSLRSLPEGPRAAVVMHYLSGLAPAEAASRLGISRAAFDTRLSRGRETLRRELSQMMEETFDETQQQVAVYVAGMASRVRAALGDAQRERVAAARELALLAARANLARLAADLKGHDENGRTRTAQLLGDTADRRAEEPLLAALQTDEQPAVLAELCRSLARVGGIGALPALRHLARQTAAIDVNKAATDAVRSLEAPAEAAAGDGDIAVSIADLRAAGIEGLFLDLLADPSPAVQRHAIEGLGRVESLKAVPRLAA